MSAWESRRASETVVPALPAGTTLADIATRVTGFGRGLGANVPSSWVIPDVRAVADLFNIYSNTGMFELTGITNGSARINNWGGENTGGYVSSTSTSTLLGRPLRGNTGVRYAKTDITATGYLGRRRRRRWFTTTATTTGCRR